MAPWRLVCKGGTIGEGRGGKGKGGEGRERSEGWRGGGEGK